MRISDWSSDVCAADLRRGERMAADPGIAEQVEEGRISLVGNPLAQPVPHRRHVGKEAEMPERRATRGEARLAPAERPALGGNGLLEIPAAATILVRRRDELAVSLLPRARGQRGRPNRLRLGPGEAIGATACRSGGRRVGKEWV